MCRCDFKVKCEDFLYLCSSERCRHFPCDINNFNLQARVSEMHFIKCEPEWGLENRVKTCIIFRATCGVNSTGRVFYSYHRNCVENLGFEAFLVEPRVYIRPKIRANGQECFECVLLHESFHNG